MAINECKFEDYLTSDAFETVKQVLGKNIGVKRYTSLLIGTTDLMMSDDCELYYDYVIDTCVFLACIAKIII